MRSILAGRPMPDTRELAATVREGLGNPQHESVYAASAALDALVAECEERWPNDWVQTKMNEVVGLTHDLEEMRRERDEWEARWEGECRRAENLVEQLEEMRRERDKLKELLHSSVKEIADDAFHRAVARAEAAERELKAVDKVLAWKGTGEGRVSTVQKLQAAERERDALTENLRLSREAHWADNARARRYEEVARLLWKYYLLPMPTEEKERVRAALAEEGA